MIGWTVIGVLHSLGIKYIDILWGFGWCEEIVGCDVIHNARVCSTRLWEDSFLAVYVRAPVQDGVDGNVTEVVVRKVTVSVTGHDHDRPLAPQMGDLMMVRQGCRI